MPKFSREFFADDEEQRLPQDAVFEAIDGNKEEFETLLEEAGVPVESVRSAFNFHFKRTGQTFYVYLYKPTNTR